MSAAVRSEKPSVKDKDNRFFANIIGEVNYPSFTIGGGKIGCHFRLIFINYFQHIFSPVRL
jgi:hypothetical protein